MRPEDGKHIFMFVGGCSVKWQWLKRKMCFVAKKDVGCGGTVFVAANCEEMRESLMATGPKDCQ